MSDVFLSYASEDIDRVRDLVDELEAQGWSVWWDRALKPGETWPSVIERQLKRARCVVVAWSKAAVRSPWVRMEANKARERGVLVPLLLEDVQIPPEFGVVQAVDLQRDRTVGCAALIEGVRSKLRRRTIVRTLGGVSALGLAFAVVSSVTCIATDACPKTLSSAVPDRSIAVLEFDNLLDDERTAAIMEAFVDELRETLAHVDRQPVAARAATKALRSDLTPAEIGDRLRVRWLVAGAITGRSDRIEVALEMIDASSGYMRGSKRYVLAMSDLQGMRQAIAQELLHMLGVTDVLASAGAAESTQSSNEAYVLYLSGKAALRGRNVDEAESFFQRAQVLEPGYPEADAGLCRVHLSRFEDSRDAGEFETAEAYCTRALTTARRSSDAGLALGELYLLGGNAEEAERSFSRALALNKSSADAQIGLARAAENDGRISDAEAHLRDAVVAQRGYWRPYNELGIFLVGQGRIDEALASFDDALALAPGEVAVLNNLAVGYAMLGEFSRAADAWSRVLELEPDAAAYGNLGSAYYWSGELNKAMDMLLRAVRLHPRDFRYWSNLGDTQLHLAGVDAAPAFERALALTSEELQVNPDNVEVQVGRAAILAALGRGSEARAALERGAEAIGQNPGLAYVAAVASVRLGDDHAATDFLEKALSLGYPSVLVRADPTFHQLAGGGYSATAQ